MAASDHLGVQFGHTRERNLNRVTAHVNDTEVGVLQWADHRGSDALDLAPHEIGHLAVEPEHQRKGVATGMFRHAQGIDPEIAHSASKTPDGRKFARAVGGPDPWDDYNERSHERRMRKASDVYNPPEN